MSSHSCTCSDPKAQVCHTHKTIRLSFVQYYLLRLRAWYAQWAGNARWALAKWVLGDLFYNTAFTCPRCGNEYCPARPEELA